MQRLMIKILRVFIAMLLGLFIAQNFNFLGISGITHYLIAALILLAVNFIVRGFSF